MLIVAPTGSTVDATTGLTPSSRSATLIVAGKVAELTVSFSMRPGWYIYAPTGRNAENGMVETKVELELPAGVAKAGSRKAPLPHYKGLFEIYEGRDRQWRQPVAAANAGRYQVAAKVTYQACKADLCLPPATETLRAELTVASADR